MTSNAALARAITELSNAIALLRPPPTPAAIYDPFQADRPFNLTTRLGQQAYAEACAPLDDNCKWDGSVETFPSFVVALKLRASEAQWDAPAPHGILTIGAINLLTEYHSINDAQITEARAARIDDRAKQNATAMFKCIKGSITGTIKANIFCHSGNLPSNTDGVELFKKLTTFTTVASLQLSLLSLNNILSFNPLDLKFDIPKINIRLNQLFVLATTEHRALQENERIQHIINVYRKILQPETWAQWVRNQMDQFQSGNLTVCQDFMNTAAIKYQTIIDEEESFKGSIHTVQEDIVALLSSTNKNNNNKRHLDDDDSSVNPLGKKIKKNEPDFLRHWRSAEGKKYVIGDEKEFDGKIFYFCDAPNHKDRIKWHTHTSERCRLRKKWLKQNETSTSRENSKPEANIGDAIDEKKW